MKLSPYTIVSPLTVSCIPSYVKPDCAIAPSVVPSEVRILVNPGS